MLEDYFKAHPTKLALLVAVIMAATVMQALDMTIANVALPHMQGSMSAAQDQITWVLTSYMIASAIGMTLTGFLTARLGRTRLFFVSVAGFTVASMMCGAAQSLTEIVIFRMIQGASGACIIPLSQAILMDVYPREKFGPAMAMWGMGVMLGPIFGPTLGGYLTENYSWRWVFFINAPIGLLCCVGILALLPESERRRDAAFDFLGFAFLAIALGALQMMLDRGQTLDWFSSAEIVIEAAIATISFYLFIVHIFTTKKPFVPPLMYADRNFAAGTVIFFTVGLTLFATMALLPSMLQNLLGYPVTETGLALMPRGIGTLVAMGVSGRLIGKVEPRLLVLTGILLNFFSMWEMSKFDLNVTFWDLAFTGVMQGVGMGLLFPPMNTAAFATLDPKYRGDSTAMFSLVRNIGSSIGISMVVAVLAQGMQINHAQLNEFITPFSRPLQSLAPNSPWKSGAATLAGELNRQASMIAYVDVFRLMAYLTLAGIPFLFFLRPKKQGTQASPPEHAVAEI